MGKLLAAVALNLLAITSLTGMADSYPLVPPRSRNISKRLSDMTPQDYLSKYGITLKQKKSPKADMTVGEANGLIRDQQG